MRVLDSLTRLERIRGRGLLQLPITISVHLHFRLVTPLQRTQFVTHLLVHRYLLDYRIPWLCLDGFHPPSISAQTKCVVHFDTIMSVRSYLVTVFPGAASRWWAVMSLYLDT